MLRTFFILLISTLTLIAFSGCASGYQEFYTQYHSPQDLKNASTVEPEFLGDNEEPKIYTTNNMARDVNVLKSRHYIAIGASSFNGKSEGVDEIKAQAKRIGATVVLASSKYTDTRNVSGVLMLPQTNYHQGTVYGTGGYATYSGTTTTTQATPYSYSVSRYDQQAVFFIKNLHKFKWGLWDPKDVTREERVRIGQFGVVVNVILEDTPVYRSDLLVGDIIVEVDNTPIRDYQHFKSLLNNVDLTTNWTVVRGDERKVIKVTLD